MCQYRHPFSLWALHLNELTPELKEKLPPTDDRLRADMRLFEHGYYHEVRGFLSVCTTCTPTLNECTSACTMEL